MLPGLCLLAFCVGAVAFGAFVMHLGTEAVRSLAFVSLVVGSQATLHAIRQHQTMWGWRPSRWVLLSSVADVLIAAVLAVGGFGMHPLPVLMVVGTLAAAAVFALILDAVKRPVFGRLKIA